MLMLHYDSGRREMEEEQQCLRAKKSSLGWRHDERAERDTVEKEMKAAFGMEARKPAVDRRYSALGIFKAYVQKQ